MKEQTSAADIVELKYALDHLGGDNKLQHITFFTCQGINFYKQNANIKNLIKNCDLFTCTVRSDDTIRWRLLAWVMRMQSIQMTTMMPGVGMVNGYLMMNGKPMASLDDIDETGEATKLMAQRD